MNRKRVVYRMRRAAFVGNPVSVLLPRTPARRRCSVCKRPCRDKRRGHDYCLPCGRYA